MDKKEKSKFKSCKRELLKINRGPLLRPDVMLVTKDVMVPVKLPPPVGKRFPIAKDRVQTKLRITKAQYKPLLSYDDNYNEQAPLQVKKMRPEKKLGDRTVPKAMLHCSPRANATEKNVNVDKTQEVSFELGKRGRKNVESVKIDRQVEELLTTPSSRNSLSSLTMSAETGFCSSSKSLKMMEDSLPKLPLGIISSSESENNVSVLDSSFKTEYWSGISSEINNSQNFVQDVIETVTLSKTSSNLNDDRIENNAAWNLQSEINILKYENKLQELLEQRDPITKEESTASQDSKSDKLIIDNGINYSCSAAVCSEETKDCSLFDKEKDNEQMKMDVEYLLQSLLVSLDCPENLISSNNCEGDIDIENKSSQSTRSNSSEEIYKELEYDLHERTPKMIEFKYSSHELTNTVLAEADLDNSCEEQLNIGLGRRCSRQELNLPTGIKSDKEQSERVDNCIEIKYSWQIIIPKNQNASTQSGDELKNELSEENSKLTCTEGLYPNEPEFQYSWQKLTSKYLTGYHVGDSLADTNQPTQNINDILKKVTSREFIKDNSPLGGSCEPNLPSVKNFEKEKRSKAAEDVGRNVANSPLNNIISSMLPEIKLNKRRMSFNSNTPEITGNYRDSHQGSYAKSNLNKSSTSYSSVSSIKHVIANLDEMVTTQKHMLDAYEKNHGLDENIECAKPVDNRGEKVEIFPSTLHVLGNYIVRDIRPADMNDARRLLDANNYEAVQNHVLTDNLETAQSRRCDNRVENILNEKIPAAIVMPAVLSPDPSIKSNYGSSPLPLDVRDEFSSTLSHPNSFDSSYYSAIFAVDDYFSPTLKNLNKDEAGSSALDENGNSSLLPILGYDRTVIENNWERAIADMEEIIGLSADASRCIDEGMDDGNKAVPHTKNTGPLKPRVQVSFSETKEAGDSVSRRDELLTRLESAINRLKQSEQHVDANWNLDYSVLDIEESISDKDVQLPKQVEEHIKDIIKSAEEYLAKLEEQLNDLRNADDQIINSSERTFKNIDETYQVFMDNLCQEINKRRNLVRLETEVFKYEGLAPLRACKQEVDAQIRSTQHLIVLTENMLTHPVTFNRERLGKIITATSHMGRIPAVPMPEELPYVTFSSPNEEIKKEIVDRISCLGCVMRMGPAQFTEVCERPACLQLKWHIADPEFASEEQTFIVQKALGEISEPTSSAFETVYIGQETSCFVRDLPVDHPITVRVGIQVSDTAWSVHRIAQTSIPAYSWDVNNPDYLITNSGRIATKVTQNLTTLLSRSPQFSVNHIIELKFLEAASGSDDEGIGLVFEPGGANESLKRNGALLITPNGNIFMDGDQKLMQLPKMELGTRIVFTSERKDDETLRMTIECANKAVTYDWTVPTPLHFAARFLENNKWNLMVK